MKKRIAFILTLVLLAALLTGCAGTTVVYYTECNCPEESHAEATPAEVVEETEAAEEAAPAAAGELKTGLAILANAKDSADATEAKYDVTIAAVTVDESGVIADCIIDSIAASIPFDATGALTGDITAPVQTKNELGEAYGMKAYAGSKFEWNEQAQALADYAVGKTVEELKNGAIDESGKAPAGSDLASTATIYLGGYVGAIEAAVNNAQALGAAAGDELRLAVIASAADSAAASAEAAGNAQLNCDVTAVTAKDGVITSCIIDSLQAKVAFDASGAITSDLSAPFQTKNELGEAYGMKAYAGAAYEWNEQAAAFAAYCTGKTAEDIAGMAVSEGKAADADIASTVTISVGGFQALIAKVMQ